MKLRRIRPTSSHWAIFFCGLVGIVEGLIEVLSLGHYTAELRMDFLLSDFCNRLEERHREKI